MPLYLSQFNYQPKFHWDQQKLSRLLGAVRYRQGRLLGVIEMLGQPARKIAALPHDATQEYEGLLTEERLLQWHGGSWRNARPGAAGAVHASSPDHPIPRTELRKFLSWFNMDKQIDPLLKAAVAHLWIMVLQPFGEGNEQIAHLVSDMQLCRADGCAQRYYDLSAQMQRKAQADEGTGSRAYDKLVSEARQGATGITAWMEWFLDCCDRALEGAEQAFAHLKKANLIDKFSAGPFNERQQSVIQTLLEPAEAAISSSQWAAIAECSQDTALRDIQDLVERGILVKEPAGGRSTQYILKTIG